MSQWFSTAVFGENGGDWVTGFLTLIFIRAWDFEFILAKVLLRS